MAEYYIDHGAYGASNRLGLDTPSWGVPQEGDGSSKDAATSASIGSIAFASVPTSGTISVCGASVSTTGVLNAASVDAAADALAANINSTTATVSSTAAVGTPQLRNLVYARGPSGGAPAGTCQIMMRVGSNTLNHAVNSAVAIAHTFGGSPTVSQFAGGSGGCWGWVINDIALGVGGSISALTYGAMLHKPMVWTATPTYQDVIWVRTGTNKTVIVSGNVTRPSTSNFYARVIFDTNTKWKSDSADGTFTLRYSGSGGFTFGIAGTAYTTSSMTVESLRQGGFVIEFATTGTSQAFVIAAAVASSNAGGTFRGLVFKIVSGANAYFRIGSTTYGQTNAQFFGCIFDATAVASSQLPASLVVVVSYLEAVSAYFEACEFRWNLFGSPSDLVPIVNVGTNSVTCNLVFSDCKFSSGTASLLKLLSQTSWQASGTVKAINCSGLYATSSFSGLPSANGFVFAQPINGLQSGMPSREFRLDMLSGSVRWDPAASPPFPTYRATLPNGSHWSMAVDWLAVNNIIMPTSPLMVPRLTQISMDAAGIKTVTVELLAPASISNEALRSMLYSGLTWYDANGSLHAEYNGTLADSTATWDGAASWPNHTARRITFTTSGAVLQYSEIAVSIGLSVRTPNASSDVLFIDPEFSIA